ncbi:MAG TPA: type II secretion system protein [Fimbriimonadaceae bacterium]|jgi:prepilin-type processing-associated H-X9-DG protein
MTELMVVVGIILILAALLFPVFVTAKAAAAKSVCVSNLHQASVAMQAYLNDYDDHFTPVNYEPGQPPDPTSDRTWVQLLLPYIRSFDIFRDPADTGRAPAGSSFNEDLVPSDTYARYYMASLKSDIGYNYIYLSPIYLENKEWVAMPVDSSDVTEPSRTLMYIDSVWARDSKGSPQGGGNWLVVPPCRLEVESGAVVDTFQVAPADDFFAAANGWSGDSSSPVIYGHAWPWHSNRFNVARVDGSIKSITPSDLSSGCQVQPQWQGYIVDPSSYIWAR